MPAKADEHLSMQHAQLVTAQEILAQYPGFGLFEIDVGVLLEEGFNVTYEPAAGRDHVAVWGLKAAPNSKLERLRKRITRAWEPVTQQLTYERSIAAP